MEKLNCKVVVCGPAIGKTYLAQHDNRFIDLDNERAIYKYGLYGASIEELEKGKLNRGATVNNDSQEYIIKRLQQCLADGKCVLLSYHTKILDFIINNNIDYCLVFASLSMHNEILQRMKNRGNVEEFIKKYQDKNVWKNFYDKSLNTDTAKYKIELKNGQYLSDIAEMFF